MGRIGSDRMGEHKFSVEMHVVEALKGEVKG